MGTESASDPGRAGGDGVSEAPPDEPREPLVAHALIVGGARGAIAGSILSLPGMVVGLVPGSGFSILDGGRMMAGYAFALGCLCGLESASLRLEGKALRRLARFGAGFLLPLAAFAPQLGILQVGAGHFAAGAPIWGILLGLAAGGFALGLAEVFAGEPNTGPHEAQGCRRLLAMSALIGVPVAVVMGLATGDVGMAVGGLLGCVIYGSILSGFVWLAQRMATPLVRPLARWLEPEVDLDAFSKKRSSDKGERAIRALIAKAADSHDKLEKDRLLGEALVRVSALVKVDAALEAVSPARLAQLQAEILLGLGELDAAEKLLPLVEHPEPLRIELARRRGDPAKAAGLALEWLASVAKDQSPAGRFARGNAHALLALARADEGHFDAAMEHARTTGLLGQPAAFQHLSASHVHAYVSAARDRARRP